MLGKYFRLQTDQKDRKKKQNRLNIF